MSAEIFTMSISMGRSFVTDTSFLAKRTAKRTIQNDLKACELGFLKTFPNFKAFRDNFRMKNTFLDGRILYTCQISELKKNEKMLDETNCQIIIEDV